MSQRSQTSRTSPTPTRQTPARKRRCGAALGLGLAVFLSVSLFLSLFLPVLAAVGEGPAGTVAALRTSLAVQGLVLREVRWDPVLACAWEIFADPVHPERPEVAVPALPGEQVAARATAAALVEAAVAVTVEARVQMAAAAVPVVHRGDRVTLWSVETNLRLQLAAVAEENGAVGERIRLSIPGAGWGGDGAAQPVRGVVRCAGEVEMEP
jgi:Chaperone for flagella basal body P-ring formation